MLANYILFLNPRLVLGVSGLFLGSFGRVWLEEGHGRTQGITVPERGVTRLGRDTSRGSLK